MLSTTQEIDINC